jgi:uncharacterized protein (TIGR02117 family)
MGLAILVLGIVFLMVIGAVVPRGPSTSIQAAETQPEEPTILLLANQIHTDIALPATPELLDAFRFVSDGGLDLDYPGVHWVIFGWGGRRFYLETPTWSDLKPGPVLAAFTLDNSVMHVSRSGMIDPFAPGVRPMKLTQKGYDQLIRAIQRSFLSQTGNQVRAIEGTGYSAHDVFFPANGSFDVFVGCNTWTARMLRHAGLNTGWWTPLPQSLEWSLEIHNP